MRLNTFKVCGTSGRIAQQIDTNTKKIIEGYFTIKNLRAEVFSYKKSCIIWEMFKFEKDLLNHDDIGEQKDRNMNTPGMVDPNYEYLKTADTEEQNFESPNPADMERWMNQYLKPDYIK